MGELFLIIISTSLVNNIVLDHMLGTDPIVAVSRKIGPAINTCIFMIITMPVVSIFSYLLNVHLLIPADLAYLQLITLALTVLVTALMLGIVTRNYFSGIFTRIEMVIPMVIVNCTLLGVTFLGSKINYGFIGSIFYGFGSALGFSILLLAITSMDFSPLMVKKCQSHAAPLLLHVATLIT